MPYIRGDGELLEEMGVESEAPEGFGEEFVYEPAEATFKAEKLEPLARLTVDGLKGLGATVFGVKYDGGFDEGFAHADYVVINGEKKAVAEVARLLATPQWLAGVRSAVAADKRLGGYANVAEAKLPEEMLYELAHALASKLLGEGFGTGEYQLYGACVADLKTGVIRDERDVEMPGNMGLD